MTKTTPEPSPHTHMAGGGRTVPAGTVGEKGRDAYPSGRPCIRCQYCGDNLPVADGSDSHELIDLASRWPDQVSLQLFCGADCHRQHRRRLGFFPVHEVRP